MIPIEWVEIPAGEFITGISEEQRLQLRQRLREDFGVAKLTSGTRKIIERKLWPSASSKI